MMSIGFLHLDMADAGSDDSVRCARAMIASARRTMPRARIVQFTDLTTKAIKGVDAVRRKPREPMGLLRMRHCAGVQGDWLFVDSDVIFQQSVKHIFKRTFDIAVTTRDWAHLRAAIGFTDRMPFNTGVVFSRCPHFWGEVYTRLRDLDPDLQHFMGEQQVICDVATETDRYTVKHLRGSIYNCPPEIPGTTPTAREIEARAAILHYKGRDRKALLLRRSERQGTT